MHGYPDNFIHVRTRCLFLHLHLSVLIMRWPKSLILIRYGWNLMKEYLSLQATKCSDGGDPIATVYAGHQFGGWNPQLGDGRAILLGEVLNKQNERYDFQLKGSGPTPYSRGNDGRTPLGPILREYIVSEAMATFGIPTTRTLAAATTGDPVYRARYFTRRYSCTYCKKPYPNRNI